MSAQDVFFKVFPPGSEPGLRRKRIMHSFALHEISAVDHPAQAGAKAMIIKRGTPDPEAIRKRAAELHQQQGGSRLVALQTARDEADRPAHPFQAAVNKIRRESGCSRVEAMQKAADSRPELLSDFRKEDAGLTRMVSSAADGRSPGVRSVASPALVEFQGLVDRIRRDKKLSRVAALQEARRLHPAEFEAYRDA